LDGTYPHIASLVGPNSEKKLLQKWKFLEILSIKSNQADQVNQGIYNLANDLIWEQIYRANFYLLAYFLNFTAPNISVTAGPIGSKKIAHVGGPTVSQAPGLDRNRSGARWFLWPPQNKKCYFSDFFSRKRAIISG
jgi:hypothetical protein